MGSEHSSHTEPRGDQVTDMPKAGSAASMPPGFSKLPVSAMRSKHAMPVMKPSEVWSIATPHCRQHDFARPILRAASTMRSSGTPQVSAAKAGVYFFTCSANSSKP